MFKVGDRVVFISKTRKVREDDFGTVTSIGTGDLCISVQFDGINEQDCTVRKLMLESVYLSPLMKALREENN